MKKISAIFLALTFILTMLCVSMPASAAVSSISWNFDGTEIPSPWTVAADNTPAGSTCTVENNMIKMYTSSNIGLGGSSISLKNGGTYATRGILELSFDFKIDSAYTDLNGETTTFDKLSNTNVLGMYLREVTKNGWTAIPNFEADGTMQGADEKVWDIDTWYTTKISVDCKEVKANIYIKAQGTSDTTYKLISSSALGSTGNVGGINGIEIHPLGQEVLWIDNAKVETSNHLAITNIVDGSSKGTDKALDIKGTLPSSYTSAAVYIDETVVSTLETGQNDFAVTVSADDMALYSYGQHTISLKATIYGEEKTVSKKVMFTGSYTTTVFSGLPASGSNLKTENGVTFQPENSTTTDYSGQTFVPNDSSWPWLFSNNGSTFSIKKQVPTGYNDSQSKSAARNRLQLTFSPYPTTGIYRWDMTFSVSKLAAISVCLRSQTSLGGQWPINEKLLGLDGKLITGDTYTPGDSIKFSIIIDIGNSTLKYVINDKEVAERSTTEANPIKILIPQEGMQQLYLEFGDTATEQGTEVIVTDIKLTKISTLPMVSNIGYVSALGETTTGVAEDAEISAAAISAVINFSEEVSYTGAALKENNAVVNATITKSGSKIYVTPASGFATGANYAVEFTGLKYGDVSYAKGVTSNFKAVTPNLGILSPKNGAEILERNVAIKVVAPADSTPVVKIDGVVVSDENISKLDNYTYVATVSPNLGLHTATVTVGSETKTVNFETTAWISNETDFNRSNLNGIQTAYSTLTNTIGPDGQDDSAFTIARAQNSGDSDYYLMVNNYNVVAAFDGDIRRNNSDVTLRFEIPGSTYDGSGNIVSGTRTWSYAGGFDSKFAIDSIGKVAGTSVICPMGEWHHLRVETNLATSYVKVFFDGVLVREGVDSNVLRNGIENLKVQIPASTAGLSISYDNVKMGVLVKNPRLASIGYAKNAEDTAATVTDATVSAVSGKIQLTLDSAFDTLTESNVKINGAAAAGIAAVTYDASAKTITLAPKATLNTNSEYVVTIDGGLTSGGFTVEKATDIRFKTNGDIADGISDIAISADKKTASVTVSSATEGSALGGSALLIFALYEGNKMTEIDVVSVTLTPGTSQTITAKLTKATESSTVKAMLWKSFDSMKPLK